LATQARIARDERVRPGGEGVIALPGEVLFVVSADGVTQQGADCLEQAWAWYIDRGLWRYRAGGGRPIVTNYERGDLDEDVVCEVNAEAGRVDICLSSRHFTQGSVNGLGVAVRSSVRSGWTYHSPARVQSRR
jgi:hypothetical protein